MAFQIGSALLDACVLAVVERRDVYGYELTAQMRNVIDVSESTLYPVLRRLQKEEYVLTYDSPINGRNRRYYTITAAGRQQLENYRADWESYRSGIDSLMKGETTENA
ncbi:MAG: PadR family transcriptional regulator [Oscillospiraceae bacterium]|nr:PadR family transcriptional regulator [Oscillospiraceae bacterium]